MASVALTNLAASDGYRVLAQAGTIGRVEEIWLGEHEEPLAVVVRLGDGRRGLLLGEDVAAVSTDDRSITVAPEGSLLHLDAPHLEHTADGTPAASWRATGIPLELPAPAALPLRGVPLTRSHEPRVERPLWITLAITLAGIFLIVCTLIGLDFLFAYLVGGGPPF